MPASALGVGALTEMLQVIGLENLLESEEEATR